MLYGAVDFYSAARAAKINPIIGCEMYMAPRSRTDREGRADRDPNHLILLARNDVGYRNLIKLVSASHLEGFYYKPRIDRELLAAHAEGLICLSACLGGELPQAIVRGDMAAAETIARQHAEIFGPDNYFLELQDHGIPEEDTVRAGLVEIARRTGLPLVATNDSHYIRPEDAEAHDILLCLQTGARREEEKRFRLSGPDYYLASTRADARALCGVRRGRVQHGRDRGSVSCRDPSGAQPFADVLADPRGTQRRHLPAAALRGGCA